MWLLSYRDLPLDAVGETSTDEADAPRFVVRASTVFNAAQVDGAPEPPALPVIPIGPIPVFDRFVAATSAVIRTCALACYLPTHDEIRLPERAAFRWAAGYCGTLTHELVHWTGAPHRLDRHVTTRFAARVYAAEEPVAELGGAFVLAGLGLAPEPHPNHAVYIAGWLPLVRDDPRAIDSGLARLAGGAVPRGVRPACGRRRDRGVIRASDLTIPVRPDVGDVLGSRSPTRQRLLALFALSPVVPKRDAKGVSTTFAPTQDPIPWLLAQFEALTAAHERALARTDRLEAALSSALTGPGCLCPRCQARLHYSQSGSRMDRSGCREDRPHRPELPPALVVDGCPRRWYTKGIEGIH